MIDLIPNVARPFTIPQYEGKPDAPTFQLRALTAKFILALQGLGNVGEALWLTALAAVVDVKNVGIGGVPVEMKPEPARQVCGVLVAAGSISEELLGELPPEWIAEIAAEVSTRHRVTADDLGKSDSPRPES